MREKKGAFVSDVMQFIADGYGVEPEYLWADDPSAVFRHPLSKKWFGIVMKVRRDRLGLNGEGEIDVLNVKLLPEMVGAVPEEEGFLPAYHMNKEKWVSILLDGRVQKDTVFAFVDGSYCAVTPRSKGR